MPGHCAAADGATGRGRYFASGGLANDYVRAAGGGGIGIGRGGGMGSGYGKESAPALAALLESCGEKASTWCWRIDGTGSMHLIIDDVEAKMGQLVHAIHRLVPIARIGMVVFGGKGEKMGGPAADLVSAETDRLFDTVHAMGAATNGKKIRPAGVRPRSRTWIGSRTRRR